MRTLLSALSHRLHRFRGDRSGLAAVEFAVILPLMLVMTFAMIEITDGIAIDRKAGITARTLADLIAAAYDPATGKSAVTDADIQDAFVASASIMHPYQGSAIKATISQIKVDSDGNTTVVWSKGWEDGALTAGRSTGSISLPEKYQNLLQPDSYLIWSEVRYFYRPAVPYLMSDGFLRTHQSFSRPRHAPSHAPCISYGAQACTS